MPRPRPEAASTNRTGPPPESTVVPSWLRSYVRNPGPDWYVGAGVQAVAKASSPITGRMARARAGRSRCMSSTLRPGPTPSHRGDPRFSDLVVELLRLVVGVDHPD